MSTNSNEEDEEIKNEGCQLGQLTVYPTKFKLLSYINAVMVVGSGQCCVGNPSLNVMADKLTVKRFEIRAGKRNQLALGLLEILFEPSTLCYSTVHGARDVAKQALDPKILEAIRSTARTRNLNVCVHVNSAALLFISGHCFKRFPLGKDKTSKDIWQKMTKAMTDKCIIIAKKGASN